MIIFRIKNRYEELVSDLVHILWPPVALLAIHIVRQIIWPQAVELDMAAHLFGGLAIAWSGANAYHVFRRRKTIPELPLHWLALFLVGWVCLISVLWEFHELIVYSSVLSEIREKYDLYGDTMHDLTLDLLGALAWVTIEVFRKKR